MAKDKDKKLLAKIKEPKNPMHNVYRGLMEKVDKKFNLSTGDFSPLKVSCGLLAIDYVCAGGFVPGMTTVSGFEASAKSTLAQTMLGVGLDTNIDLLRFDDAEGTIDGVYTSNIIGQSIAPLLPEYRKGKLVNDPRIWYSLNNEIEIYYDSMVQTLSALPDKRFSKEHKQWFYVVQKDNKKQQDFIAALKNTKMDTSLSRGKSMYYPTSNTKLQGIFFIDSYPSMITHSMMEKEEANNMPTGPAIKFSINIPRITGYFKRKGILLFGVNQMREKPGMAFGAPFYEPMGNALKQYSNTRLLLSARAVQKEWKSPDAKNGQVHVEHSVEYKGKEDQYAYKHVRNLKLKHGTPYLECWQRVWIKDGQKLGQGRGFCKVHDTFEYLLLNDLITVEKGRIKSFTFKDLPTKSGKHPISGKTISWQTFKVIILNEYLKHKTEYLQSLLPEALKQLKLKDQPLLRAFCAEHLKTLTAK